MDLGLRIKRLRQGQRRTLVEIAEVCGFTPSLLSKIENGKTSPPVATLTKIAKALGTTVSALVDDAADVETVLERAEMIEKLEAVQTEAGYSYKLLAGKRSAKLMQPILFTAVKGEVAPHRLSHAGEEFIYVLEGRGRYRVGDVLYDIGPGDSLYFDSEHEHEVTPITDKLTYLAVFVG